MQETDIIIIGGGACGLLAANELSRYGAAVTLLEARDRLGGRIHTIYDGEFSVPVEAGAEFIHGDMPVTLNLLHKAGIEHYEVTGQMWESKEGKLQRSENFIEDWDLLEEKLQTLTDDMTISEFLNQNFPGEKHEELRKSVMRFVEGYDAADTTMASTFSLRDEWLSDENASQYRIKGGYGLLIDFLEKQVKERGGEILLETLVSRIEWEKGKVTVSAADGKIYVAEKVLITVPLSILQKRKNEPGYIAFHPDIPDHLNAAGKMGFGGVIKILIEFTEAFWNELRNDKHIGPALKKMGFVFSPEKIPTWWTQYPASNPLMTGWLAGPRSFSIALMPDKEILEMAMKSLSSIFQREKEVIQSNVAAWQIANWTADLLAQGAYAYDTLHSREAVKILMEPVGNTLFFAGEAVYHGAYMGTVEAALTSALDAVARLKK